MTQSLNALLQKFPEKQWKILSKHLDLHKNPKITCKAFSLTKPQFLKIKDYYTQNPPQEIEKKFLLSKPENWELFIKTLEDNKDLKKTCEHFKIGRPTFWRYKRANNYTPPKLIRKKSKLLTIPTQEEWKKLLKIIEKHQNITKGCQEYGISTETYYRTRKHYTERPKTKFTKKATKIKDEKDWDRLVACIEEEKSTMRGCQKFGVDQSTYYNHTHLYSKRPQYLLDPRWENYRKEKRTKKSKFLII